MTFESVTSKDNEGYRKIRDIVFKLGDYKDYTLNLYCNSDQLISPDQSKWSLNNKIHLRTLFRNFVISAGIEDFDLHDKKVGRLPKVFSINTSCIHNVDNNKKIYLGTNMGVNLFKKNISYGYILGGIKLNRRHRLIAVFGGKASDSKRNDDNIQKAGFTDTFRFENKENLDHSHTNYDLVLRMMGRSVVNEQLDVCGEYNLVGKDKSFAIAAKYFIDSKTALKARLNSKGDLTVAFLHDFGLIKFNVVSQVVY